MTFEEYIQKVKEGKLVVVSGYEEDGRLIQTFGFLDPTDARGATAEAFNQDVLDPAVSWDVALAMIKAALGLEQPEEPRHEVSCQGPDPDLDPINRYQAWIIRQAYGDDLPEWFDNPPSRPARTLFPCQLVLPFPSRSQKLRRR